MTASDRAGLDSADPYEATLMAARKNFNELGSVEGCLMRDYGLPMFWTGEDRRSLVATRMATCASCNLMTSPHASMIGVFTALVYISTDTDSPLKGCCGLARPAKVGFARLTRHRTRSSLSTWQRTRSERR